MGHKEKVSIVLSCIDYRFWPDALPLLEQKFGEFDLIELAGGSKNLSSPTVEADRTAVLESIKVSVELHGAKQIILTNHIDCGAYGGSEKFKTLDEKVNFHKSELEKAGNVVIKSFPNLAIKKIIISHDNKGKINLL
jgi:carbonic anhydrase